MAVMHENTLDLLPGQRGIVTCMYNGEYMPFVLQIALCSPSVCIQVVSHVYIPYMHWYAVHHGLNTGGNLF